MTNSNTVREEFSIVDETEREGEKERDMTGGGGGGSSGVGELGLPSLDTGLYV